MHVYVLNVAYTDMDSAHPGAVGVYRSRIDAVRELKKAVTREIDLQFPDNGKLERKIRLEGAFDVSRGDYRDAVLRIDDDMEFAWTISEFDV